MYKFTALVTLSLCIVMETFVTYDRRRMAVTSGVKLSKHRHPSLSETPAKTSYNDNLSGGPSILLIVAEGNYPLPFPFHLLSSSVSLFFIFRKPFLTPYFKVTHQ